MHCVHFLRAVSRFCDVPPLPYPLKIQQVHHVGSLHPKCSHHLGDFLLCATFNQIYNIVYRTGHLAKVLRVCVEEKARPPALTTEQAGTCTSVPEPDGITSTMAYRGMSRGC
jgi:hypothetical protein